MAQVAPTQRMQPAREAPGREPYPTQQRPPQQRPPQQRQPQPQSQYRTPQPRQPQPQQVPSQRGYSPQGAAPQQFVPKKAGLSTGAKVGIGVAAAALVVVVILVATNLASGGAGGDTTGGTDSPGGEFTSGPTSGPPSTTGTPLALTDSYSDETYGYSFMAPAGANRRAEQDAGKISLSWTDPDLWVNAYVGAGGSLTPSEVGAYLVENYDATVVEVGSDYVITVCTDEDGDTNYTKVYVTGSNLQYLDIYYHPSDEDTMHEVAFGIMESFTAGESTGGDDLGGGTDVPVEINTDLFEQIAEGATVTEPSYGFSLTTVDDGFSQMQVGEGSLFLIHKDPRVFVSCYGEQRGYESLTQAYEEFVRDASAEVECSEATYDEAAGFFVYTETDPSSGNVILRKVYVGASSIEVFVATYEEGDTAAADIAARMADTFVRAPA